jgi:hypothetical protein
VNGKHLYENDLKKRPFYHTGEKRKTWECLSESAKWSWNRIRTENTEFVKVSNSTPFISEDGGYSL